VHAVETGCKPGPGKEATPHARHPASSAAPRCTLHALSGHQPRAATLPASTLAACASRAPPPRLRGDLRPKLRSIATAALPPAPSPQKMPTSTAMACEADFDFSKCPPPRPMVCRQAIIRSTPKPQTPNLSFRATYRGYPGSFNPHPEPRTSHATSCHAHPEDLWRTPRKVDARLPGKGNANSHGARPVHLIQNPCLPVVRF